VRRHRAGRQFQAGCGVALAAGDVLAGQLAVLHRVVADDALRHLAIRDGLHLQRMHLHEIGDLVEGEGGLLDQPHGGCLGHQGLDHVVYFRQRGRWGAP
jgi:hypothetical protein